MALADDYVACRQGVLGHAWDDIPFTGPRPSFGAVILARCTRCTTERRDLVARETGRRLSRKYYYPEGYKWASGSTAPTAEELRRIYLRQRDRKPRSKDGGTVKAELIKGNRGNLAAVPDGVA